MKILVTGAAGFIGTHLCNELMGHDYDVVGVDKSDGDLLDPFTIDKLLDLHHPDVVVHLAAKVGRAFGEDDLAVTVNDNAVMTSLVARACGDRKIQLVYASTSEVYGDMGTKIAREGGPWELPHNLYGLSKRWGEEAASLYAPEGLVRLRLSMPYGPGLPAGRGRAALVNFLWNALNGQPLTVHRGSERSWCWVGDTARAIRMIIEAEHSRFQAGHFLFGLNNEQGVWNVGRDDNATSMRVVAEMACAMTGAPMSLIEEVDPPGMQTVVKRLATDKIRRLGWSPTVELGEGMKRTLTWIEAGFPAIQHEEE